MCIGHAQPAVDTRDRAQYDFLDIDRTARQLRDVGDAARSSDDFQSFYSQYGGAERPLTDAELQGLLPDPHAYAPRYQMGNITYSPLTGYRQQRQIGGPVSVSPWQPNPLASYNNSETRARQNRTLANFYRNNSDPSAGRVLSLLNKKSQGSPLFSDVLAGMPGGYHVADKPGSISRDEIYRRFSGDDIAGMNEQQASLIDPGGYDFYSQIRGMDDDAYSQYLTQAVRSLNEGDIGGSLQTLGLNNLIGRYGAQNTDVQPANLNQNLSTQAPAGQQVEQLALPDAGGRQQQGGGEQIKDPFQQPIGGNGINNDVINNRRPSIAGTVRRWRAR